MDLLDVTVDLPAYSHTFQVRVPVSSTVRDVKREITNTCVGKPKPEGQRVISRGRVLQDDERVQDIWKGPDDSRFLLLSVHPSAWGASPPELPASSLESLPSETASSSELAADLQRTAELLRARATANGTTLNDPTPTQPVVPLPQPSYGYFPQTSTPAAILEPQTSPLTYVLFRHNNALLALMQDPLVHGINQVEMQAYRALAIETVNRFGWSWPSILDLDFPAPSNEAAGVKYERGTIGGQQYLTLLTPDATPTPLQQHALNILAYTFPLLSLTLPNAVATANIRPTAQTAQHLHPAMIPDLNAHLQQLGLPPLHVNQTRLLLRTLLVPVMMLALRACILLYVFSPTRKPMFALAIVAWVAYELWNAIHAVFNAPLPGARPAGGAPGIAAPRAADQNNAGAPAGAGNGNAAQPQAVVPGGVPGAPAVPQVGANRALAGIDGTLAVLARFKLDEEERALAARPEDAGRAEVMAPPSVRDRLYTFVYLFGLTLFPAFWEHRCKSLREREGQERMLAALRSETEDQAEGAEEQSPEELGRQAERRRKREELLAQHARRPMWVKRYIERMRGGDWIDHE